MSSFNFWIFIIFDFGQKKLLRFFGSGPIWAHFAVFEDNNSSKQRLIEPNFWPQVALIVVQIPFKAF